MYKLVAKTISRLISWELLSIFAYKVVSPIILAALRISRQVSSNLTIHLTIDPSGTAVKEVISENG